MGFFISKLISKLEDSLPTDSHIRIPKVDIELKFRVLSVLCYFFILVIIGIPVWWYTTRVYRADLPLNRMLDLEVPEKSYKQLGIPLSLEYDILVTIVNPDLKNVIDIDGEDIETNLKPFLKKISPIANFVIKSQWLYLVELGAPFRKILDHYALNEEQLPHIITPLEKRLWSHLSTRPCINLVLYVSPCHVPLYIYDKFNKKNKINAFISPGWGGIFILNPDEKSCEANYYKPNLNLIVSTFITQLKKLFNIERNLDNFLKRKTNEMIISTRRTLKSLAHLLSEIPNIVIADYVGDKIEIAVDRLDLANNFLNKNETYFALKAAKIAYKYSEAAFKDPSLLALLYFPDDQKYAVYIPLFLPVMIPVLMSLITVRNWYNERKNKQKIE